MAKNKQPEKTEEKIEESPKDSPKDEPVKAEVKAEEVVETVEAKPETMTLVAYQDDGGVIKKVKTALGDTYTLDELLAIIRSKAVRCVMNYDGREVDVSLSGSGISAMEGTTDLLPKLATF